MLRLHVIIHLFLGALESKENPKFMGNGDKCGSPTIKVELGLLLGFSFSLFSDLINFCFNFEVCYLFLEELVLILCCHFLCLRY